MSGLTRMALAGLLAVSLIAVFGCGKNETATAPTEAPAGMQGHADHGEQQVAQKTCPVMGLPISEDVYVDYEGRRIYFCCEGCPEEFMKDPEKYLAKLDGGEAASGMPEMKGHEDHSGHAH